MDEEEVEARADRREERCAVREWADDDGICAWLAREGGLSSDEVEAAVKCLH